MFWKLSEDRVSLFPPFPLHSPSSSIPKRSLMEAKKRRHRLVCASRPHLTGRAGPTGQKAPSPLGFLVWPAPLFWAELCPPVI